MYNQYHLAGKGFSGRAVRLKELPGDVVEDNLLSAAKLITPDALGLELKKKEWRNGIKLFVVQLSQPCKDVAEAKWVDVKPGMLEDLSQYFTAKDLKVLEKIYQEYHEVGIDEIEAIVGKAIPVSEG